MSLRPAIREMLEDASVAGVYDYAPSALECPCPIVIASEKYTQSEVLEGRERGRVALDVIAVRETRSECPAAVSEVVYALHRADWGPWGGGRVAIRGMSAAGLPEELPRDGSGWCRMKVPVAVDVCVERPLAGGC